MTVVRRCLRLVFAVLVAAAAPAAPVHAQTKRTLSHTGVVDCADAVREQGLLVGPPPPIGWR